MYKIISTGSYILLLHFQFGNLLFPFFCLIALYRASSTMLNRNGENGHPVFIPDLWIRVFTHWLLSMMLTMAFITLDYVLSMPNLGVSIMEGYCILSDAFCTSIDRIICFLSFILLMWFSSINVVYHNYWFAWLEASLHPRDKSHLILVHVLLMYS